MRSDPRPVSRFVRIVQTLLCIAGFVSPWLFLIPLTPARIPLAIFSCGLAVACGLLLPGTIRRIRYPESRLEPWSPVSNASRIWRGLNRICGVLGLVALAAAILLFGRPQHHGGINWPWTFLSTGMMFNFWSMLIGSYRLRRNAATATAAA